MSKSFATHQITCWHIVPRWVICFLAVFEMPRAGDIVQMVSFLSGIYVWKLVFFSLSFPTSQPWRIQFHSLFFSACEFDLISKSQPKSCGWLNCGHRIQLCLIMHGKYIFVRMINATGIRIFGRFSLFAAMSQRESTPFLGTPWQIRKWHISSHCWMWQAAIVSGIFKHDSNVTLSTGFSLCRICSSWPLDLNWRPQDCQCERCKTESNYLGGFFLIKFYISILATLYIWNWQRKWKGEKKKSGLPNWIITRFKIKFIRRWSSVTSVPYFVHTVSIRMSFVCWSSFCGTEHQTRIRNENYNESPSSLKYAHIPIQNGCKIIHHIWMKQRHFFASAALTILT